MYGSTHEWSIGGAVIRSRPPGIDDAPATDDAGDMKLRAQILELTVGILVIVAVTSAVLYLSGSFSMTSIDIRP